MDKYHQWSAGDLTFCDTETLGFLGPVILIQTGRPGEDPELHDVWDQPVSYSLALIEELMTRHLNIFNATFDSFHLHKWYNICRLLSNPARVPDPEEVSFIEKVAWEKNPYALRPAGITDSYLMLKMYGLPQMNRFKKVTIKSVPVQAVGELQKLLEEIPLPSLLFKGYNERRYHKWRVTPAKQLGFVHITLEVKPSLRLKDAYNFIFNESQADLSIPDYMEIEHPSYDPHFSDWLPKFKLYKDFWNVPLNRKYAADDIYILDRLWNWLSPRIPDGITLGSGPGKDFDVDSILAWSVGGSRFRGFPLDLEGLKNLAGKVIAEDGIPTEPRRAVKYLHAACSPMEQVAIGSSSKKVLLALSKQTGNPELAKRAEKIFAKRQLATQRNLLAKLADVGQFHPDFNICGTASNRMSGTGGINAQGIQASPEIRSLFRFRDNPPGLFLCGGDFDGQEVTIFDAVTSDPLLHSELAAGKSIHKLLGSLFYGKPIEKGMPEYNVAKTAVFAMFYGVARDSLGSKLGFTVEKGQQAFDAVLEKYPSVKKRVKRIERDYCSMTQPGGTGTQVIWEEPKDTCTSLFGYTRSFVWPNAISKFLFNLSEKGIHQTGLKQFTHKIFRRRGKEQTVLGATRTALFAAAFNIQSENLRVANNHEIQATGAFVTKYLQAGLALLQPLGAHPYCSLTMNVHDEVLHVTDDPERSERTVKEAVEFLKGKVPLLSIGWKKRIDNWSEIKG